MRHPFRPELFVTLAVCLAACAPEEAPAANRVDDLEEAATGSPSSATVEEVRPIVVMLGDSLTAGYQLPPESALPEAIQQELTDESVEATIVNAGVSGDTTRGGLERFEWSVEGVNADILLIALGANDFLSGIDAETPKANLADLIERAKAAGMLVGLIGISVPEAAAIDSRDAQFDAIYPELAGRYELDLYPNMLASVFDRPDLLMPDGLHPTAEGVEHMADDLAPFVARLVGKWRAAHPDL